MLSAIGSVPFRTTVSGLDGTAFTGASFTDITWIVLVAATLGRLPSVTIHATVRSAVLGFSLVFRYVTLRNAVW